MSKKASSITQKIKGLFFKDQSEDEDIKICKDKWKEKEGVKWVYFKEHSEKDTVEIEDLTDDLTPKNYAEYIIQKQNKDTSEKNLLENSFITDDDLQTFSVTEFAEKFGHRTTPQKTPEYEAYLKDAVKKPPKGSITQIFDEEKQIADCIDKLKKDPRNIEIRKQLINLYFEREEFSEALKECLNLTYRLPGNITGISLAGDITCISPYYIFQLMINLKQTGKISFFLASEEVSIFFIQGKAVHAEDKWGKGEDVIKRILSWREGYFNFFPNNLSFEQSIHKSLDIILAQVTGDPLKTTLYKNEDS
ncbi:MAG TPA: DUF4388 domain-containing protein [Candidatus Eremiobacteraeota bacterium]|nr:MAG: hypothetical protein BWY64_00503 [bacterium ADurb.Bin363]HPZ07315.1 DUF4388 domain-containing protein [Candidatus Eremiobacteraeota bacterium]